MDHEFVVRKQVQNRAIVRERSGIELQPEIEFVGDWSGWTGENAR